MPCIAWYDSSTSEWLLALKAFYSLKVIQCLEPLQINEMNQNTVCVCVCVTCTFWRGAGLCIEHATATSDYPVCGNVVSFNCGTAHYTFLQVVHV